MKTNYILNLIHDKITVQSNQLDLSTDIEEIEWRLEKASTSELVFYKLSSQGVDALAKRLIESEYGLLIMNQYDSCLESYANWIVVKEDNWKEIQKIICDYIYPYPEHLKLVGVTGTNGKTTTVELARQLAQQLGFHSASIGTLGTKVGEESIDHETLTTPPYIHLRKIFYKLKEKVDVIFLEISSHGLDQNRIFCLELDSAGWTSFGQDHLDYHKNEENYFQSKTKIVNYLKDQKYCWHLLDDDSIPLPLEDRFKRVERIDKLERGNLPLPLQLDFNWKNLILALYLLEDIAEKKFDLALLDFNKLLIPPGRLQFLQKDGRTFIIDYAHTPDALETICKALKDIYPSNRLHVLFGCGGDRDKGKRPLMAQSVSKYADQIYITSDNPRNENPTEIINDILDGLSDKLDNYFVHENRFEAMKLAVMNLKVGDILLLAGKGHETYQIINEQKFSFDEKELISKIWDSL